MPWRMLEYVSEFGGSNMSGLFRIAGSNSYSKLLQRDDRRMNTTSYFFICTSFRSGLPFDGGRCRRNLKAKVTYPSHVAESYPCELRRHFCSVKSMDSDNEGVDD